MASSGPLETHVQTLQSAESLKVDFQVQTIGGGIERYNLALARPDRMRLESADRIVTADGTNLTVFLKGENVYFKKPQTKEGILSEMGGTDFAAWRPFLDAEALSGLTSVRPAPNRNNRKGVSAKLGAADLVFYADPKDGVVRQMQITTVDPSNRSTLRVLTATQVQIGSVEASSFQFNAPAGAREVDQAALLEGKWLKFDQAMEAARMLDRPVMIDFMAEWCGPCKMMEAQVFRLPAFKEATKGMILAKVDVDREPALAARYQVSAMPNIKFVSPDGAVRHEFLGYSSPQQVLGEVLKARQIFGLR